MTDAMAAPSGELGGQSVADEIRDRLRDDSTRLGDVYRLVEQGLEPTEVAQRLSVPTAGFVYSYRLMAETLISGIAPNGPVLAGQFAGRVRKWLREGIWSVDARAHLESTLERLEAVAERSDIREEESRQASESTARGEESGIPGVYVYTYPHYLRHPYEPSSGRTLLKVGQSGRDAANRAVSQVRGTFVPEDPWLLRIYTCENVQELERSMHSAIDAADHDRSPGRRAGREWFVTSTKFLDVIANLAGASVAFVNDFDVLAD
ncbi:GIY-YIG nuclease family protein [Demequina phytophila]|uniref:GIY-YIG nuclease family protein n=1 Tax=Demequina phytophila TaxID=1638981 RepID=UPI0007856490|nr:GIY-YIG nuclease family protein [Demequina phytophila]